MPDSDEGRICLRCRFWEEDVEYGHTGLCRRHAPRPSTDPKAAWPVTGKYDWCGEHEPGPDD